MNQSHTADPLGCRRNRDGVVTSFRFLNSNVRDHGKIREGFLECGMVVEAIQLDWPCWTWVMTDTGALYLHDTSHGGGGQFTLEKT